MTNDLRDLYDLKVYESSASTAVYLSGLFLGEVSLGLVWGVKPLKTDYSGQEDYLSVTHTLL